MGEVFWAFLRLGLTAFGGPVAHIGYFRNEFVDRRKWLNDETYADLVALSQFLPGPASSQVGFAIGLLRGGFPGAIAAWVGFTLPSAVVMLVAAFSLVEHGDALPAGLLAGLKAVVVAVVAHALIGMGRNLTPDVQRLCLAAAALALVLFVGGVVGQLAAIVLGAFAGLAFLRGEAHASSPGDVRVSEKGDASSTIKSPLARRWALMLFAVFFALLFGLPFLASHQPSLGMQIADGFYRSGALVFGGGHVVLPLLQAETVGQGLVTATEFTAGYGLAQAVPGPLFTFSAFLGGTAALGLGTPAASLFALVALVMIFLPGALLVAAALPFWSALRSNSLARAALNGVNAAVVGILGAALYTPVATTALNHWSDGAIAVVAFFALAVVKLPAWVVVPIGAVLGVGFAALT